MIRSHYLTLCPGIIPLTIPLYVNDVIMGLGDKITELIPYVIDSPAILDHLLVTEAAWQYVMAEAPRLMFDHYLKVRPSCALSAIENHVRHLVTVPHDDFFPYIATETSAELSTYDPSVLRKLDEIYAELYTRTNYTTAEQSYLWHKRGGKCIKEDIFPLTASILRTFGR